MKNAQKPPGIVLELLNAIKESGLTVSELARRSGIDHGRLSRFLRQERTLTLPAAAKICEVLGLCLVRSSDAVLAQREEEEKEGRLSSEQDR